MTVTLREMASGDIARLVDLDAVLFAEDAWPESTWWAELAQRPRRDYLVLEESGEIIGYGGLDVGGETADVMTVAVAPDHRGRGHAGRLVTALEERARARGATGALLEVRADNAAALAVYRRAGWRQVHVRRRYYQPGDVDALILAKTLAEVARAPVGTTAASGNNAGEGSGG